MILSHPSLREHDRRGDVGLGTALVPRRPAGLRGYRVSPRMSGAKMSKVEPSLIAINVRWPSGIGRERSWLPVNMRGHAIERF